jgi:hypothetical protein
MCHEFLLHMLACICCREFPSEISTRAFPQPVYASRTMYRKTHVVFAGRQRPSLFYTGRQRLKIVFFIKKWHSLPEGQKKVTVVVGFRHMCFPHLFMYPGWCIGRHASCLKCRGNHLLHLKCRKNLFLHEASHVRTWKQSDLWFYAYHCLQKPQRWFVASLFGWHRDCWTGLVHQPSSVLLFLLRYSYSRQPLYRLWSQISASICRPRFWI